MKYNVGDLLLLKDCKYKPRLHLHPHLRLHLLSHLFYYPELSNSFGMVTQAIKHNDAWEGDSTSDDNVYVWFSQLDAKEYTFCENEVTGEVVE